MSTPGIKPPAAERSAPESFLSRVNALVDWPGLSSVMETLSNQVGVKLPLSAVKIALLKQWYELADASAEFAILDRLSFRNFVGFAGDGSSSDVEILNELREAAWTAVPELQSVLDAVEEQLRGHGLSVRPGRSTEPSMNAYNAGEAAMHTTADTLIPHPGDLGWMVDTVTAQAHSLGRAPTGPQAVPENRQVELSSERAPEKAHVTQIGQLQNERVWAQVEWPWGERSNLIDALHVGRDYAFSPFARELTPYTHVSRRHAELVVQGGSVWIRDLGSRNGTFVNNDEVPTGQAFLIDSDVIVRFGPLLAVSVKLLSEAAVP